MATAVSFEQSCNNEFTGEIVILSVRGTRVGIVPKTRATGENAPSHRVFVGRADYAVHRITPRSVTTGPSAPTRVASIWASSSMSQASMPPSLQTSSTMRTVKPAV